MSAQNQSPHSGQGNIITNNTQPNNNLENNSNKLNSLLEARQKETIEQRRDLSEMEVRASLKDEYSEEIDQELQSMLMTINARLENPAAHKMLMDKICEGLLTISRER